MKSLFRGIVMGWFAFAFIAAATLPARASDHVEYYMHNGSVMKMVWDQEVGEYFEMFYQKPRAGLGVKKGTLLMTGGMMANGDVNATARLFKKGCKPIEYEVSGSYDDAGTLTLVGATPRRDGCAVVGQDASENSVLVFTPKK